MVQNTSLGSAKADDPIYTQGAIIGKMIYQRPKKLEEKPNTHPNDEKAQEETPKEDGAIQ